MPSRQRGQQTPNTAVPQTPLTGSMLIGRPANAGSRTGRSVPGSLPNFDPATADALSVSPRHGIYMPDDTVNNIIEILSRDPRWEGQIRLNEFVHEIEICPPLGFSREDDRLILSESGRRFRDLQEEDATKLAAWLDRNYLLRTNPNTLYPSIQTVARLFTYHPVRDFLDRCAIRWQKEGNNKDYASRLIADYFGGEDTPLNAIFSVIWLVNAIARIQDPGCQVHESIVLVGKQGAGKSKAIRILATGKEDSTKKNTERNWFSDSQIDLKSKDKYLQIRGTWIYEIAEMAGFTDADAASLKGFMSSPADSVRDPFARKVVSRPRSVVFVGTTNDEEFLGDPNGEERRWWPVKLIKDADLERLKQDYELIWGSAMDLHLSSSLAIDRTLPSYWWPIAAENAKNHRKSDPWEEPLQKLLRAKIASGTYQCSMGEMLACVGLHLSRQSTVESKRMGSLARILGWERKRTATDRYWTPSMKLLVEIAKNKAASAKTSGQNLSSPPPIYKSNKNSAPPTTDSKSPEKDETESGENLNLDNDFEFEIDMGGAEDPEKKQD